MAKKVLFEEYLDINNQLSHARSENRRKDRIIDYLIKKVNNNLYKDKEYEIDKVEIIFYGIDSFKFKEILRKKEEDDI